MYTTSGFALLNDGPLPILTISNLAPARRFTFPGPDGRPAVTLNFGATPHTVEIAADLEMNEVARQFWRSVARVTGAPDPFGGE